MQGAAINPTLKAPGTKRLKLKCDDLVANFGFKYNLRRNTKAMDELRAKLKADALAKVGR